MKAKCSEEESRNDFNILGQSDAAMSALVVIPARGGSRGVPRKNLRIIGGVPLIAHTIQAALGADEVERVVVTTDDDDIAAAAARFGAEIVRRPAELAADALMPEPAVLHVLDALLAADGYDPELTLLVQSTAPLVEPSDIDGVIALLGDEDADSAFAAAPFPYFLWRQREGDAVVAVNHDQTVRLPRQAIPPQYLEAGSVYAMKTAGLRQHRHRFFGKMAIYPIPRWRAVEIDDEDDIIAAEALLAQRDASA